MGTCRCERALTVQQYIQLSHQFIHSIFHCRQCICMVSQLFFHLCCFWYFNNVFHFSLMLFHLLILLSGAALSSFWRETVVQIPRINVCIYEDITGKQLGKDGSFIRIYPVTKQCLCIDSQKVFWATVKALLCSNYILRNDSSQLVICKKEE